MFKSVTGALTAQNATETVETGGAAFTVPKGVTKVIGVGITIKSAGLTTLEGISGILRLSSSDMTVGWAGDQIFPLPMIQALTNGSMALNPYVYPTDIDVQTGGTITPYVTFDLALTINPSWRVQLIFA